MRKLSIVYASLLVMAFMTLSAYQLLAASDGHNATAPHRVNEEGIRARLQEDGIVIAVPVEWDVDLAAWGTLEVELVDLQGKRISGTSGNVVGFKSSHIYSILLKPRPDLANSWRYVLKYKLATSDGVVEGRKSLAECIGMLETRLIGSTELLSGAASSLRLIALDHSTGEPIENATVSFALTDATKKNLLYQGRTDRTGTVDARFRVPDYLSGRHTLVVEVRSPLGDDLVEQPVSIIKSRKILLTTDKPLYQPGQTIHIRSLSLSASALQPSAREEVTLEVQDSKGNKVFKKTMKTDKFGLAAADFELADEVNTGLYKVRVILGESQAEKDITVKRYVLPKFKVALSTEKQYYMPGETLRGEIQADYFFGKPVTEGLVVVKLSKFDVEFSEFARIEGKTDGAGHFSFETKLPDYFVGQPLQQGKAFVKADVRVVDNADHKEELTRTLNIASDPLTVVAIPESGTLVPHVMNTVYLMVTYPDGTSVHATLAVRVEGTATKFQNLRTDELGITAINVVPSARSLRLVITAHDTMGATTHKTLTLNAEPGEHHVLLRTDQALYGVGDTVHGTILSTRTAGTVYVAIVKNGQTVLTRSVAIDQGLGSFEVELTPDLAGSLQMNAYQITRESDIVSDCRLLYVNPADDLSIQVTLNKEQYRPGEEATIDFFIRDGNGHAVLAAIGVSIVDESVFALQEMQPGLERVYFTLEKELMTPRYEIHGYTMPDIIGKEPERDKADEVARRQEAAKVLLASAETFWQPSLAINTLEGKRTGYTDELRTIMQSEAETIEKALSRFFKRHERLPKPDESLRILVDEQLLHAQDATDPWGNFYHLRNVSFVWKEHVGFELVSLGPDERPGTNDDIGIWHQPQFERRWRADLLGVVEEAVRAPMAGKMANGSADREQSAVSGAGEPGSDKKQVRIREYFPETLYFNPAIITNPNGRARISLRMADSITTWRMASMASSLDGVLGSTATPIRVFQDFFIDIDLPVALTQHDRISIPIAVYNYLPEPQTVELKITKEDWFRLLDEPIKTIRLKQDEVSVVYFTIVAEKVGWHSLTVHGVGSQMSDAIKRQILVVPDGKEFAVNFNDRLEGSVEKKLDIPATAIDDASTILVKIYAGMFSQVVEGLDSILRMPFGCFEQTSSVTYPNVLVLDYLKQTKQLSPEIQMKAEGFINTGYQRLLSFEVNGGGFEWFGNPPANQILTAYGLMEFKDMAKVHEVDRQVIERTRRWLLSKQQSDGSWAPDQGYLNQESWSRIQNSSLPVTAYIAWALLESGDEGPEAEKAVRYITQHLNEADDPYILALCANALALANRQDDSALSRLDALKIEKDNAIHWESKLNTMTYSHGDSADIETTALAAIAFLRSGRYPDVSNKVMTYLIRSKDPSGTWASTQATVLAMKAMAVALGSATEEVDGVVTATIDGKQVAEIKITPADSDVMRLVDLKKYAHKGANTVGIDFAGKGAMLYQIVGRYYLPWSGEQAESEPLSIQIGYDKTRLEKDDLLTCAVRIMNNTPAAANMLIIDLGVPPGFEVQSEALQELVTQKTIEKYSLTGRQIIVYLRSMDARASLSFSYKLRAKYPIKAKAPTSRVYEYYNPSVEDFAEPVVLEIKS
ncbi:MAG: hypothetical protein Kow0099_16820 [Candidatus Abyssubacteria bacterium]